MKATFKTRTGCLIETSQVDTEKDLFRAIAKAQEIFSADDCCGSCGGQDISFRHRIIDENEYFELACRGCTATLKFGQSKKGSLFPKLKDKDGAWLPNRGWTVYRALAEAPQQTVSRRTS